MGLLIKPEATPNVATMRHAAEVLGIEIPDTEDPNVLVPHLRNGFAERLKGIPKDDWIVCEACGENTDDAEELNACPFCGDDGLDHDAEEPADPEAPPEPVDAADIDPVDENAPEEPPVANVGGSGEEENDDPDAEEDLDTDSPGTDIVPAEDSGAMLASLNREKHLIKKAQTNMVRGGYHLGTSLARIHNGELWKAEGHKTFRKFLETVGVSSTMAYDLMGLVEKFDEKTFMEVGRKRLLIVAKADKKNQKGLLDKAKDKSKTRAQLEKEAQGDKAPKAPVKEDPATAPGKEDQITLLAKVGARPKSYRFTDRETKKALATWTADSYVEIQISDTVTQLLGLKTNDGGDIVGITVAFTKREAAKVAAKSNGKTETTKKKAKAKTRKKKVAAKKAAASAAPAAKD